MNWPIMGGTMSEAILAIVSGVLLVILSMAGGGLLYVVIREIFNSNQSHGE